MADDGETKISEAESGGTESDGTESNGAGTTATRMPDGGLHPLVKKGFAVLMAWAVVAAWSIFAGVDFHLIVLGAVMLTILIALLPPYDLGWAWRHERIHPGEAPEPGTFRRWAASEIGVMNYRLRGRHVAVDALLPVTAVVVTLILLAVVKQLVSTGVVY